MHPSVQWHRLTRSNDSSFYPEWHEYRPRLGQLDYQSFKSLIEIVSLFSSSTTNIILGYWKGYSDVRPGGISGFTQQEFWSGRTLLAGREFLLLESSLENLRDQLDNRTRSVGRIPGVMWPVDRSWYLHSEVDFDSTLVGGPRKFVDTIINDDVIEAVSASPEIDLSIWGDTINR